MACMQRHTTIWFPVNRITEGILLPAASEWLEWPGVATWRNVRQPLKARRVLAKWPSCTVTNVLAQGLEFGSSTYVKTLGMAMYIHNPKTEQVGKVSGSFLVNQ